MPTVTRETRPDEVRVRSALTDDPAPEPHSAVREDASTCRRLPDKKEGLTHMERIRVPRLSDATSGSVTPTPICSNSHMVSPAEIVRERGGTMPNEVMSRAGHGSD